MEDGEEFKQLQDSAISLTNSSTTAMTPPPTGAHFRLGRSVSQIGSRPSIFYRRQSAQKQSKTTIADSNQSNQNVQLIVTSSPSKTSLGKGTSSQVVVRPMYKKDIFYSGSIQTIATLTSKQSIRSDGRSGAGSRVLGSGIQFGQSTVSIPAKDIFEELHLRLKSISREELDQTEVVEKCRCWPLTISPAIKNVLREMLNMQLVKNWPFAILGVSNIFGMIGFYVPFIYMTQYSTQHVRGNFI